MPETVGTFVAFLLLVTPGLIFELLRDSSRPERVRSTFRETSIVVVASVAFSAIALAALLLVRSVRPEWLPSPTALVRSPTDYVAEHLGLIAKSLAAHVLLATAAALGFHRLLRWKRPGGDISPNPAWFEILRGNANPRRDPVLLFVELQDGSAVRGVVKGYDLTPDQTLRTLVLWGSPNNRLTTRNATTGRESALSRDWAYIVVRGDEIKLAFVAFVNP